MKRTASFAAIALSLLLLFTSRADAIDVVNLIREKEGMRVDQQQIGRKTQILLFSAEWCGPCRKFKEVEVPRMKESGWKFGETGHVRIVDVDQEPDLASQYNVRGCPTAVALRYGVEKSRSVGAQTAESIHAMYVAAIGHRQNEANTQGTPYREVWKTLEKLNLRDDDVLVDFGCGDGRVCIAAVRGYGCRAIGIEIDPYKVEEAREEVEHAGLSDRIEIIQGDATVADFENANVGFAYLWPNTLKSLSPRIGKLERFASYQHQVPGLRMAKSGNAWLWNSSYGTQIQQPQQCQPCQQQACYYYYPQQQNNGLAYWEGRWYSAPQCSSSWCTMCNSIRSQLANARGRRR